MNSAQMREHDQIVKWMRKMGVAQIRLAPRGVAHDERILDDRDYMESGNRTERRRSRDAQESCRDRDSAGAYGGKQGRGRPDFKTPQYNADPWNTGEAAADESDFDTEEFINYLSRCGIDDQDIEHCLNLLNGSVEAEDAFADEDDSEESTPGQWQRGPASPPSGRPSPKSIAATEPDDLLYNKSRYGGKLSGDRRRQAHDRALDRRAYQIRRKHPKLSFETARFLAMDQVSRAARDREETALADFFAQFPEARGIDVHGAMYSPSRGLSPRTLMAADRRSVNSIVDQTPHETPHRQNSFSRSLAAANLTAEPSTPSGPAMDWLRDVSRIKVLGKDPWR